MKTLSIYDHPECVFGIPFFKEKRIIERLPKEVRAQMPQFEFLGRRANGARMEFRTDAAEFSVKMTLETLTMDVGVSIFGCQSANVLIGERGSSRLAALVGPMNYQTKVVEKTITKPADIQDVMICLPRNEVVIGLEVILPDDASFLPPKLYKYAKPMLFYGSSITEGGCGSRLTNAYTAILSRWLDADYYNFGFSGAAKGEPEMADYINTIEKSVFIYDYDHNAPNVEHLKNTHEPFFRRIRDKNPDLPVIIMSRPDFDGHTDAPARRKVIYQTYLNAATAGDRNVYFIDGESFYGDEDRDLCTVDGCHPTDLGFYRMAQTIYPTLKRIFEKISESEKLN